MAIQRDTDSLPHFDQPDLRPEDWAKTYPALKIHSSGSFFYSRKISKAYELSVAYSISHISSSLTFKVTSETQFSI